MNSTLTAKLEALRSELEKDSGEPIAEVSSKTIAGWWASHDAEQTAKTKGGNEKAKAALRDAEKNLKATIASFEALKRAEPELKDIIETYTVAHLKDWISGPSQGSIRMLWAELRDIEQRNAED